jgi:hypothetical protein
MAYSCRTEAPPAERGEMRDVCETRSSVGEGNQMKPHLTSVLAGLFLAAGVAVSAADTVVIEPEQEVAIREYVKKKPIASVDLPGIELNVGATVPETVELHALEVPDVEYQYVVVEGRTVLVEPGTRKIVRVLD